MITYGAFIATEAQIVKQQLAESRIGRAIAAIFITLPVGKWSALIAEPIIAK